MTGPRRIAVVVGGPPRPALDALVERAVAGARAAGAEPFVRRVEDAEDADVLREEVLGADAFLFAAPIVLFGLPGTLKAFLDGWLALLPQGRLTARTAGRDAGYLALYDPDDDAARAALHAQMRGIFAFLGMNFRGHACGHAPAAARAPKDASLPRVAERLGAVLAGERGYPGYPEEYLAGIRLFNEGEYWEAHEAWEELWLEAEEPYRTFFQGLIQVAAALHHHGRSNWGGMAALFRDATAKLDRARPRLLGLDVDAFLAALEPWRALAEARAGKSPTVLRLPRNPPTIRLDDPAGR